MRMPPSGHGGVVGQGAAGTGRGRYAGSSSSEFRSRLRSRSPAMRRSRLEERIDNGKEGATTSSKHAKVTPSDSEGVDSFVTALKKQQNSLSPVRDRGTASHHQRRAWLHRNGKQDKRDDEEARDDEEEDGENRALNTAKQGGHRRRNSRPNLRIDGAGKPGKDSEAADVLGPRQKVDGVVSPRHKKAENVMSPPNILSPRYRPSRNLDSPRNAGNAGGVLSPHSKGLDMTGVLSPRKKVDSVLSPPKKPAPSSLGMDGATLNKPPFAGKPSSRRFDVPSPRRKIVENVLASQRKTPPSLTVDSASKLSNVLPENIASPREKALKMAQLRLQRGSSAIFKAGKEPKPSIVNEVLEKDKKSSSGTDGGGGDNPSQPPMVLTESHRLGSLDEPITIVSSQGAKGLWKPPPAKGKSAVTKEGGGMGSMIRTVDRPLPRGMSPLRKSGVLPKKDEAKGEEQKTTATDEVKQAEWKSEDDSTQGRCNDKDKSNEKGVSVSPFKSDFHSRLRAFNSSSRLPIGYPRPAPPSSSRADDAARKEDEDNNTSTPPRPATPSQATMQKKRQMFEKRKQSYGGETPATHDESTTQTEKKTMANDVDSSSRGKTSTTHDADTSKEEGDPAEDSNDDSEDSNDVASSERLKALQKRKQMFDKRKQSFGGEKEEGEKEVTGGEEGKGELPSSTRARARFGSMGGGIKKKDVGRGGDVGEEKAKTPPRATMMSYARARSGISSFRGALRREEGEEEGEEEEEGGQEVTTMSPRTPAGETTEAPREDKGEVPGTPSRGTTSAAFAISYARARSSIASFRSVTEKEGGKEREEGATKTPPRAPARETVDAPGEEEGEGPATPSRGATTAFAVDQLLDAIKDAEIGMGISCFEEKYQKDNEEQEEERANFSAEESRNEPLANTEPSQEGRKTVITDESPQKSHTCDCNEDGGSEEDPMPPSQGPTADGDGETNAAEGAVPFSAGKSEAPSASSKLSQTEIQDRRKKKLFEYRRQSNGLTSPTARQAATKKSFVGGAVKEEKEDVRQAKPKADDDDEQTEAETENTAEESNEETNEETNDGPNEKQEWQPPPPPPPPPHPKVKRKGAAPPREISMPSPRAKRVARESKLFEDTGLPYDAPEGPAEDEEVSALGTIDFDAGIDRPADGTQDERPTFAAWGGTEDAIPEEENNGLPSSAAKDPNNCTVFEDASHASEGVDDAIDDSVLFEDTRLSSTALFRDFEKHGWTASPMTDKRVLDAFGESNAFDAGGATAAAPTVAMDEEELDGLGSGIFGDGAFGGGDGAFGCNEEDCITADDDLVSDGQDGKDQSVAWSAGCHDFGKESHQSDGDSSIRSKSSSDSSQKTPLSVMTDMASAASSKASDGTAIAAAAAAARLESFRNLLSDEQLAAFEGVVSDHEARVRKLEEGVEAKEAEVEFMKGEVTAQHDQILTLLDRTQKGEGDSAGAAAPDADGQDGKVSADVAALEREIADLRVRLGASEAAVVQLEWEKGRKGNKKLKKGAKKLNEVLNSKKGGGGGGGGMMMKFSPSRQKR